MLTTDGRQTDDRQTTDRQQTDDGLPVVAIAHLTLRVRWAKNQIKKSNKKNIKSNLKKSFLMITVILNEGLGCCTQMLEGFHHQVHFGSVVSE